MTYTFRNAGSVFKTNCTFISNPQTSIPEKEGTTTYKMLQVLGPEHEFSIVDEKLTPLPIVDKVIRAVHGHLVNCASLGACSFGKELQAVGLKMMAITESPTIYGAK
jgi:hypothetical protein